MLGRSALPRQLRTNEGSVSSLSCSFLSHIYVVFSSPRKTWLASMVLQVKKVFVDAESYSFSALLKGLSMGFFGKTGISLYYTFKYSKVHFPSISGRMVSLSFAKLLKKPYYSLKITLFQNQEAKLPYYGPIARGWLNDALHRDEEIKNLIAKNPNVDVRPYFLFTNHKNREVYINLNMIGFSRRFIKDIVKLLGEKVESNLGGVDCSIKNVSYSEKQLVIPELDNHIRLIFSSPTAIFQEEQQYFAPSLDGLVAGIVRSYNRFAKYYLKSCYPIHISDETKQTNWEITGFDLNTFLWEHRSRNHHIIPLKGVWGHIDYSIEHAEDELKKVLCLPQLIQMGKWISYGFGKMEVGNVVES